MELLREWIMSLVAVSLLSALVRSLVGSGSLRRVAEFICALALLAALLRPLPGVRWEDLLPDTDEYAGSVTFPSLTAICASSAEPRKSAQTFALGIISLVISSVFSASELKL